MMLRLIRRVNQEVSSRTGMIIPFKIGTMVETPRAALLADRLAQWAEFLSFGTNDLTQLTYGFSRTTSNGACSAPTWRKGLMTASPFAELDEAASAPSWRSPCPKARQVRPDIKIGICGEHGGDPSSIAICESLRLDYVSCSPTRSGGPAGGRAFCAGNGPACVLTARSRDLTGVRGLGAPRFVDAIQLHVQGSEPTTWSFAPSRLQEDHPHEDRGVCEAGSGHVGGEDAAAPDSTLDRDAADGVMNELDEYAVEEALQLAEAHGGEVVGGDDGPGAAAETVRKALSMGADPACIWWTRRCMARMPSRRATRWRRC